MLIIDGERFAVEVEAISRKADFLDKYAERTEDGVLKRELIGVYINYTLQLFRGASASEYDRLWDKLIEPVEFHQVTVPGTGGDYTFTAYFSGVSDQLQLQRAARNYWINLTVTFTAERPART